MTVIAWDGKTLAADKRASCGGVIRTVTKICRLPDGSLFGGSGDFSSAQAMRDWLTQGAGPDKFPERQRTDDYSRCLVITDGRLRVYERTPIPIYFEDAFFATGSGFEAALVAMHLGKNAVEAVEIACLFNSDCGNGVDVLTP